MNEELFKKVIQFKINAAGKIINRLPPETAAKLKTHARFVCDSVAELLGEEKNEKAPPSGRINNVRID